MNDMELYARYFPPGIKVGVGIPLPNAEVFKDWAIIHELDEDLVTLQLSRELLPAGVTLRYGQILELRGGEGGDAGYSCRAIIVSEGDARELLMRLVGEIVSDELREFYRIDAFLPIKYYVSREQRIEKLFTQWEERRERRIRHESAQEEGRRWDSGMVAGDGALPKERHMEPAPVPAVEHVSNREPDDSWDTIIPLAANISGGGLRLVTHQGFENGEYVLLEILVPAQPQRVVDVVARVIFANRNYAAGKDQEYFNTGMQFVYIDERDRDVVVNHISNIQLKRIRQLRERYLFRGDEDTVQSVNPAFVLDYRKIAKVVVSTIIFVAVALLFVRFFWNYSQNHPKGEIEEMFEGGIKKYIEKHK